jgi:hypothetical protein
MHEEDAEEEVEKEEEVWKAPHIVVPPIRLPFPSRVAKKKQDPQLNKSLDVEKNLQVTIPSTELISQIPSNAKIPKDILTEKRELKSVETSGFSEQCSVILQNKSPPKLRDPGSFCIPCDIGTVHIDKALCDLGASVSVMPLSVCKELNMGDLKCTSMTLQTAEGSLKHPLGILEDVPVRVGRFYIPVDFVVLNMEEDVHIPIILGRPFLHTAGAVINVRNGKIIFNIGDEKVTFNQTSALESPMLEESCCSVGVVDVVVQDKDPRSLSRDLLEGIVCVESFAGEGETGKKTTPCEFRMENKEMLDNSRLKLFPTRLKSSVVELGYAEETNVKHERFKVRKPHFIVRNRDDIVGLMEILYLQEPPPVI